MRYRTSTPLRRRVAVATVAAAMLMPGPWAPSAVAHGGHGEAHGRAAPDNIVQVLTTSDGAFKARARVTASPFGGDSADSTNLAFAEARDCTGCRSRAAALQAVFLTGHPTSVTPTNLAVALNTNCKRCESYAFAYQYVVSPGGRVRLTSRGRHQLRDIQARAREAVRQDAPLPVIDSTLQGLAAELKKVVDTELRAKGKRVRTHELVKRDMSYH